MIDLDALHARLTDLPDLGAVSMTPIAGRLVFGFKGLIAAIDPRADINEAERAIRKAYASRPTPVDPIQIETPMPPPASTIQPQGKPMSTPTAGSFAAQIRAMMDEARAGVAQARADGVAKVGEAIGKLNEAKAATAKVAGNTAQMIEDEAASVMSELGQLSNDLGA